MTFIVVFGRLLGLSWDERRMGKKLGRGEDQKIWKIGGPTNSRGLANRILRRTNRISFETPTDATTNFLFPWIIRSPTKYVRKSYVVNILCAIQIPSFDHVLYLMFKCPKLLNPAIHARICKEAHHGCCYCLFQLIASN
jgi:hypothetical protein